jgi:hypothetical protein
MSEAPCSCPRSFFETGDPVKSYPPDSWRWGVLLVFLGAVFGVLNSACNHGLSEYGAKVIGNDWGWLVAGFAVAWPGRTWKTAFGRGITFLFSAVVAYYTSDAVAGVYTGLSLDDPTAPERFMVSGMLLDIVPYLVISTFTAMALALIVALIHRGGVVGLFASLLLPAFLTWDAWNKRQFLSAGTLFRPDPVLLHVAEVLLPIFGATTVAVFVFGVWRLEHGPSDSP